MIIADTREKTANAKALTILEKMTEVKMQILDAGDYAIPYDKEKLVLVERSTATDLLHKFQDGRIWEQIKKMSAFTENHYLIIEEPYRFKYTGLRMPSLTGLLKRTCEKTTVLWALNPFYTACYIMNLVNDFQKGKPTEPISVRFGAKADDIDTELRMVLEGYRGIGGATSKKLLEEFKSIEGLVSASESDLQDVVGKSVGQSLFKRLRYKYGDTNGSLENRKNKSKQ